MQIISGTQRTDKTLRWNKITAPAASTSFCVCWKNAMAKKLIVLKTSMNEETNKCTLHFFSGLFIFIYIICKVGFKTKDADDV